MKFLHFIFTLTAAGLLMSSCGGRDHAEELESQIRNMGGVTDSTALVS